MRFFISAVVIALTFVGSVVRAEDAPKAKQVLELRTYTVVDAEAEAKLDAFLKDALIPALERQELGPIGAFDQAGQGDGPIEIMLLIAGPSAEAVTTAASKLPADETYQAAAKDYLSTPSNKPLIKRIRSELLMSFDCWPKTVVPKQKQADAPRLFELRTYESASENLGDLKVEMFNSGEVPIFLDCDIQPVFMGQALVGERMPNLTYMTVYDDAKTRDACWKKFISHPDWKVFSKTPRYKGTVSKIHKSDWVPKPYSKL